MALNLFLYEAFDSQRRVTTRGSWWARDQEQADFWLRSQGYTDIRLKLSPKTVLAVRVQDGSLTLFYRQLSVMFRSGVALPDALRLASFTDDQVLAGVCLLLSDKVSSGHPLSGAMKTFPSIFDRVTVGLLAAAEQSGRMPQVLHRLAESEERRYKLKRAVIAAVTYPALLCLSTLILTGLFAFYIFPINKALFSSMNLELPLINRVLFWVLDILTNPMFPVLLLGFGGWLAVLVRSRKFRDQLRARATMLLLSFPPARVVVQKAQSLRMLEILGLLLDGGGTVDLALKFMIAAGDRRAQTVFTEVRGKIMNGSDFGEALKTSQYFPPLVSSLLEIGYETGRIESMALKGAELCEEDVRLALASATALLEPLLLAFAGLIAGVAVVSSALPMMKLIQAL